MNNGHDPPRGSPSRSAAGDRNPWLIAVVVSIATFMLVLDTSIANVALLNIAGGLAASQEEATWVITTYLVANAIVVPISGWLASVIGRKRYYMICVAIFTMASLMCGLAWNLSALIFFRVLQGLGGGGMAPSEQAILADTFRPEQRSQAFALYGVAVIIAPTVGPTLGGWITDNYSWHWIFFINIPFGILSLVLVQWLLVEPEILRQERRERLRGGLKVDFVGFVLVALWLGCLEIVLDQGQLKDWFSSDFILISTAVSLLAFFIFLPWELYRKEPIVDVRLMFSRQFGTSFVIMMAVGAILFGSTQILPQLLQSGYDYSAYLSGLSLMPGGIAMLLMMPVAGVITNYIQPKYLIAFGMAVIAIAMWQMTSLSPHADFDFFAWTRVYQMIGLPLLFIPINTAAYAELAPEKTSNGSALINMARNLGGSFGISLANTEIARRLQFHHARLVENATLSSSTYQDTLKHATNFFITQGESAIHARDLALAWIAQMVQKQSVLLAYIDIFWVAALFAACMVPIVLIMLKSIDLRAPASH
jgi:MFS transporter, DHA2 family, multidrug resistance protein